MQGAVAGTLVLAFATVADAQIDGIVLINQAAAEAGGVTPGDAPGFPVTISLPGSYRLAGNLSISDPNLTAIQIITDNVSLDLNGHTIRGPADSCLERLRPIWCSQDTSGVGVLAGSDQELQAGVSVFNGIIRSMGRYGVRLGQWARVDRLMVTGNRYTGVFVATGSLVSNSQILKNGEHGIVCDAGCVLLGNTVFDNKAIGIGGARIVWGHNYVADNQRQVRVRNGLVSSGGNACRGNHPLDCPFVP